MKQKSTIIIILITIIILLSAILLKVMVFNQVKPDFSGVDGVNTENINSTQISTDKIQNTTNNNQNQTKNSTYLSREEIKTGLYNLPETQKLLSLESQIDSISNEMTSLTNGYTAKANAPYAQFGIGDTQKRMSDYELSKMQVELQGYQIQLDGLVKEHSILKKNIETQYCDLNSKIKSETDRSFCHSLFN